MSLSVDIEKRLGDFHLRARFECEAGVTGLLGPSGCGKSMTLKCIAGIERPDRGRIVLDDRVLFDSESHVDLKPRERRVGYLFQNYALFPNMTVAQNIRCGLCRERDEARRKGALDEALALGPRCFCWTSLSRRWTPTCACGFKSRCWMPSEATGVRRCW